MEERGSLLHRGNQKLYGIALATLVACIGYFFWWRIYSYPFESTSDANIAGVHQWVSPLQAGQIMEMRVDEGEFIKQGDVLFILNDALFQIDRQKALSSLAYAENQVLVQQIQRELAEEDYRRALKEFNEGIISPESMEHIEKNFEMTKAVLLSALSLVKVQIENLNLVDKQIELCCVRAPVDGVIAKRWHVAGDVVREGQGVLSLIDLSEIWISANLEETKISAVHKGDFVEIFIDAYPELKFQGNIAVIGAAAASQFTLIPSNNSSGNFTKITQRVPLKITMLPLKNGQSLYLRPGMSAKVKIRVR